MLMRFAWGLRIVFPVALGMTKMRAALFVPLSAFASVAILNEASLGALGDRFGRRLERERFRGNVWLSGLAPLLRR